MFPPNLNPGWIWAHLSEAVFDFRSSHGAFPALIRVSPDSYRVMAREAKTLRPTVAGVPVQPDSDLSGNDFLLDRKSRAHNPL